MYKKDVVVEPIDLVYLWCDGSDPQFVKAKSKFISTTDTDPDCVGELRYIQCDELRYSLRSVWKYLPWINHIYIVTFNQRPHWLKEHPKVSIIDHKEIIPECLLPTFSSVTIEMYLDRIPGLSEKFLYANDDIFFNTHLKPEYFFNKELPIVQFSGRFKKKLSISEAYHFLDSHENSAYRKTLVRAWLAISQKYNELFEFFMPSHSVDAFTKTIFREVLSAYPQLLQVNSGKFRTGNEIQRLLFQLEMVHKLGCPYNVNKRISLFRRIFFKESTYSLYIRGTRHLNRKLFKYAPMTFCLNNVSEDEVKKMELFLAKRFPHKAPWEC